MDSIKPKSSITNRTKLARTIQKVINLKTTTKIASHNGNCTVKSEEKLRQDSKKAREKSHNLPKVEDDEARHGEDMEALISKLFACITSIKSSYAELQMAQNPYSSEAIQAADRSVVEELKSISNLKNSFLKREIAFSNPQVTLMLTEIREQQSLMKTYAIIAKKLEAESARKQLEIDSLKEQLNNSISSYRSSEKRLNSSGSLSIFDNLQISLLNPSHFVHFLHYTLKSVRSFVKLMIHEMELAHWDIDAAAKAIIDSNSVFVKHSDRIFAFESFVCKTMFEGFDDPKFMAQTDSLLLDKQHNNDLLNEFNNLRSINPIHLLSRNPNTSIAKFTRSKYLGLVHSKMECSIFGNSNHRKVVNSSGVPDSAFFASFAEMSKRVWLLHCLAFSIDEDVGIFQVRKNSRFSEVYMERVAQETSFYSGDFNGGDAEPWVWFTVVPGLKIGETVIQSRVYLFPSC